MKNTESLSNQQRKLISSLYNKKKRYEYGLCICEGLKACREVYYSRPELIQYGITNNQINLDEFKKIKFYSIPPNKFDKSSGTVNSQGILFLVKIPSTSLNNKSLQSFSLILDKISDPGNLGTIIRTSAAVGLKNIWITNDTSDPYSEKSIRSAMAAQFKMGIRKEGTLLKTINLLKTMGYSRFYKTDPAEGNNCFEEKNLFGNSILILGNESTGIESHLNLKSLTIPMPGNYESINVAQSATVLLFEAVRRDVLK